MLFLPMNGSTEAEVKPRQANTFGKTLLRLNVFAPLRARLPNSILVDTRETLAKVGESIWSGREDLNLRHPAPKGEHFFYTGQYPANTMLDRTTEYPRLKERFVVSC